MTSNQAHSVERAVNEYESGLLSSIRKAANYHGVAQSTVAYRRAGRDSFAKIERKSQRLLNEEEKVLLQYL